MKNKISALQTPSPKAKSVAAELFTVRDFVRYGVSRFSDSQLFYGHGTDNAYDEAVFIVLEGLHLPIDAIEPWWDARLTVEEREKLAAVIEMRVETRKPASYLLNKAYIQGMPFYIDERALIPRSFIAEILAKEDGFSQIPDYDAVESAVDICTGSGCLAIMAAHLFPNAAVDAVDLSGDALEVAKKNVADYGLEDKLTLYKGDLFTPLAGKTYDFIITNPPYVDAEGMEHLPPEYEHEPALALAAGDDGLAIVHRLLKEARKYLNDGGGILCEVGRCGPALEAAYPDIPFLWIDTEHSSGEVFWLRKDQLPA
ncbi:MAG: 50S ribosomal protein L3 N(5)-glutamine methyltransferase [Micavibrio aeruginosavorus]|uniref:50S ribosomal protein L3 N(5)-glutamine methyltransferase n=1 Tax=Micavibrio aeruginosavorus TaxID=349221 RepID=A0A2W5A3T7_9BACT|nr:MAG: 50S ribosomal protein L3 N(5)-glutamine methyltransferase [Micavibrio aeruginosavorus]